MAVYFKSCVTPSADSQAENPAVIICNVGDSARINYRETDKENALVNATDFAITGKADGAV